MNSPMSAEGKKNDQGDGAERRRRTGERTPDPPIPEENPKPRPVRALIRVRDGAEFRRREEIARKLDEKRHTKQEINVT